MHTESNLAELVLLIGGLHDGMHVPKRLKDLATRIPQAQMVFLEGPISCYSLNGARTPIARHTRPPTLSNWILALGHDLGIRFGQFRKVSASIARPSGGYFFF